MLPKTSQDFSGFSWASPDVPDASPDLPSSLRTSQGFPGVLGFPRMSQGLPRASLGCPDVPGAPRGFPGVSWASPDVPGTSPGLPGPPGRPRGFPGPPWDVRMCQGLPRASLESPRLAQMSQRLPQAFCGLPDFQRPPKASLRSLGLRTYQGLPRGSLGQSGPSRASLSLPWIPWGLNQRSASPYPQFNAGEARFRWDWQSTCRLTESQ